MTEYSRTKKNKFRTKHPITRRPFGHGGLKGGSSFRPRPPPQTPRRNFDSKDAQKSLPKEDKPHWNGKVEVWTEPQKPKQEKIIKYEVDTDKLLLELSKGNKEALKEIAEKLKEKDETNTEQSTDLQDTEKEEKKAEPQKTENSEPQDKPQDKNETQDKTEPTTDFVEKQETLVEAETEPKNDAAPKENPLDAPELEFMKPSFWDNLETQMSSELERLEPREKPEIPREVGEPVNEEGY